MVAEPNTMDSCAGDSFSVISCDASLDSIDIKVQHCKNADISKRLQDNFVQV